MAEGKYVTTKSAVSVPYADGRHVAHGAGESIAVSDLAEHVQSRLGKDPWLDNLFDSGGDAPDPEEVNRKAQDAAKLAMEGVEALTRERADLAPEERFGADSRPKHDFDVGRTLPTSGADLPADEQFAEGDADTSEAVSDEDAKTLEGDPPAASEAPRAVEKKAKAKAK